MISNRLAGFYVKDLRSKKRIKIINNVEDQLNATIKIYCYSNQLNIFRAIFCPSPGAQDCVLQHVV